LLQQWSTAKVSKYTSPTNTSITTTIFQILHLTRHDIVPLYHLTNLGQLLVNQINDSYNNNKNKNTNHMTISNNSSTLQESQHTILYRDGHYINRNKIEYHQFIIELSCIIIVQTFIQQVWTSNSCDTKLSTITSSTWSTVGSTITSTTWTTVDMDLLRLASPQHPLLFVKPIECILKDFVIISADVSYNCSVGSTSCHATTTITTTADMPKNIKRGIF
jgi:hypothetical protein